MHQFNMSYTMANVRDFVAELEAINKLILKHHHVIIQFSGNVLWVFKIVVDDSPLIILEAWIRGREINLKVYDQQMINHRIIALTVPSEFEAETLTIEASMDGVITFSAYRMITTSISAWILDPDIWSKMPVYKVPVGMALQTSIGDMLKDGRIPPPDIYGHDICCIKH